MDEGKMSSPTSCHLWQVGQMALGARELKSWTAYHQLQQSGQQALHLTWAEQQSWPWRREQEKLVLLLAACCSECSPSW